MLQSNLFYKTNRHIAETDNAPGLKFLFQGDYVERLASGIYSFLPLGWRVMSKIAGVIREEMNKTGAQEVFLPTLQPKKIWEDSGRWETMEPPLFKLKDQHKKDFALGPTHEEVITRLAQARISSYRDLPRQIYQIQTKFRNEIRSTGGLLRTREFLMKDLYSFHANTEDLADYYEKVAQAYLAIFKRLELKVMKVDAVSGSIGGETSHEFMVPSSYGEDKVFYCSHCGFGFSEEYLKEKGGNYQQSTCEHCSSKLEEKACIECGHIFNLGDKYSKSMNLQFVDEKGEKKYVLMGCYGIGLGRLMATVTAFHHDKTGIVWPKPVAPFDIHILNLGASQEAQEALIKKLKKIEAKGQGVLYDNRTNVSNGEKLIEADLIGCPLRLVLSPNTWAKKSIELKKRNEAQTSLVELNKLEEMLGHFLK